MFDKFTKLFAIMRKYSWEIMKNVILLYISLLNFTLERGF